MRSSEFGQVTKSIRELVEFGRWQKQCCLREILRAKVESNNNGRDLVAMQGPRRCSPKTLMVPNPHSHRLMRIQLQVQLTKQTHIGTETHNSEQFAISNKSARSHVHYRVVGPCHYRCSQFRLCYDYSYEDSVAQVFSWEGEGGCLLPHQCGSLSPCCSELIVSTQYNDPRPLKWGPVICVYISKFRNQILNKKSQILQGVF